MRTFNLSKHSSIKPGSQPITREELKEWVKSKVLEALLLERSRKKKIFAAMTENDVIEVALELTSDIRDWLIKHCEDDRKTQNFIDSLADQAGYGVRHDVK